MPNKQVMAVCEAIGGFIEKDDCIFREMYIDNANLECEKVPLFGKNTTRFMTNEESLLSLGIKHRTGSAIYSLCEVPLSNIMNISWRSRQYMADRAVIRVEDRMWARKRWNTASEGEKVQILAEQRERYTSLTPYKKEQYRAEQRERYTSLTPAEKKQFLAKKREKYTLLSPKEREQLLVGMKKRYMDWYASLTPDEKKDLLEQEKEQYASMSPKEKEQYLAKKKEYYKKKKKSSIPFST